MPHRTSQLLDLSLRRVARFTIRRLMDLASRVVTGCVAGLPVSWLERAICGLVEKRAGRLAADEALRFLFRLDSRFYALQGQKAVEYGGGLHTKHRHIGYHEFFISRIHKGERVLDVGCGVGAVAYDVAERAGAQVVAIDFNARAIEEARKRRSHRRVEYRVGNVLEDALDGPFDVVILSNVLEHLQERSAFLRRLKEAAKPSRILIRVPLFERDWRVPLKRELGMEWRLDPTHEIEYAVESFDEELGSAGLILSHREVRWGEIWAEAVARG
ncbi:MAG: class I SAM-dependent methyltransferase [Deltaproteobacteria bacterium]|nr:class I SAM-dependent methyltransferase [Deltaproteobacteria bacterium]